MRPTGPAHPMSLTHCSTAPLSARLARVLGAAPYGDLGSASSGRGLAQGDRLGEERGALLLAAVPAESRSQLRHGEGQVRVARTVDLPVDRQSAAQVALFGVPVALEAGDLGEIDEAHGDLPVHGTVRPLPQGE